MITRLTVIMTGHGQNITVHLSCLDSISINAAKVTLAFEALSLESVNLAACSPLKT